MVLLKWVLAMVIVVDGLRSGVLIGVSSHGRPLIGKKSIHGFLSLLVHHSRSQSVLPR